MLATHPDIQKKVRHELETTRRTQRVDDPDATDELGYDRLSNLPWLDAVIKETLRLYPPVPFVRRVATRTCTVPLLTPIKPLDAAQPPMTSVTIPEGTTLFVGIAAANRSPLIWGPDAHEWRPERWLGSEVPGVQAREDGARLPGVYSGMMTFLGGGRSCVGFKFAQIEIKIILATLLMRFRFSATSADIVWNLSQIISPSVKVTADDGTYAAPPAHVQEVSKATAVVKHDVAPLINIQEEERKHLETLHDAAHDPEFLDARRCIMLPARASDLQDVHFVDPMDFVGFSKVLPHARSVQYGQLQSAHAKTASSLTLTLASPPKLPSAVTEPLSLAAAAAPSKVALQDFSVIQKLGSGASGVVYLVRNDLTQKLFALKKMEKEFLDPEAVGRLVQEQRMLRKVRGHDHVVGLEASFHDQENFFLVMPFLAGGDMRTELHRCGRFQTQRVVFYAAQIMVALEFIHGNGIIHRDIKPENLLFDAAGNVRVCDFGISKQFETVPGDIQRETSPFWTALTRARRSNPSQETAPKIFLTSSCNGTPIYSAPEVFQGKAYSYEVDLWSLGVVVYEMATGRTPFKDSTNLEEVHQSVEHDEISFKARDQADLWVQLFVIQVLRKNPEDRLALKAMKDHQFFQTIDWEMLSCGEITPPWAPDVGSVLSDVAEAEQQNDGFKIPSAEPVVPDSFPHYAFQSELFVNSAPSSAKSSGYSTASESSVDSSATSFRQPELALPSFPSYLFEFSKFAAAFAAMSPSISSSSLGRRFATPPSDDTSSSSSSSSASGSDYTIRFDSPTVAQTSFSQSSSPSLTSRKPFADLRRWAKKLRV
ncbi:hypothetical protein EWM64_g745 [Hericium alpestre]|uniref:Protein kinase domain-containing protein n=1 Tax=Hericium alpestre TaxID=135208 RepID=A0A4Z0AAA5_9AGAM|nr:hypothetical protein EWM64_g745 [Hericium alpestre]